MQCKKLAEIYDNCRNAECHKASECSQQGCKATKDAEKWINKIRMIKIHHISDKDFLDSLDRLK